MANRITSLCIDCADAELLANFWCEVLGYRVIERDEGGVRIGASPEDPIFIDFLPVPDGPKTAKNRLHVDLNATDRDRDAELDRLVGLGAQRIEIGQSEAPEPVSWYVLADPEGNEFCLLRTRVDP
ncbi:MAG: VOC family protein [Actinobacteria bacterium]|nr:VOC family protein [Actinomycetota bacterium]